MPGFDLKASARLRRLWAEAHQRRLRLRVERFNNMENLAVWQRQVEQVKAEGRPVPEGLVAWITWARARLDELGEELPAADEALRVASAALRAADAALDEQLRALDETPAATRSAEPKEPG